MLYVIKNKIYLRVSNYYKEVNVENKDGEFSVTVIKDGNEIELSPNVEAIPITIEEAFSYRSKKNARNYNHRKLDELDEFEERMV